MRWIRVVLASVICAGALAVFSSGSAFACSCAVSTVRDYVGYADVIMTGTLVDMAGPPEAEVMSSGDPVTYTVGVDQTFEGEAGDQVEFTSAVSGASCGLEGMAVGTRYAFFLSAGGGGHLTASLCGGTQPTSAELENQIAHWTGPPTSTEPEPEPTPDSETSPAPRADDTSAGGGLPSWTSVAAGGAVVVLLGGAFSWWARRRGVSRAMTAERG